MLRLTYRARTVGSWHMVSFGTCFVPDKCVSGNFLKAGEGFYELGKWGISILGDTKHCWVPPCTICFNLEIVWFVQKGRTRDIQSLFHPNLSIVVCLISLITCAVCFMWSERE